MTLRAVTRPLTHLLVLVCALTCGTRVAYAQLPGPPVGAPQSVQSNSHGYNFQFPFTPDTADGTGIRFAPTLFPSILTGMTLDGVRITPTFTFANANQATTTLTGFRITTPTVTLGGSTVTNTALLKLEAAASGGSNNYSLWSVGPARFDASVAAAGAIQSSSASAGVGYTAGAGCAVTQGTNRTTGVTCTGTTGAITLFSAAGSATPASFTVTDTSVAATDTIIINEKSGTDLYEIFITNVAAGSFKVTFFTTGGTTTEQPVFNFAIVKGSAS